MNTEENKIIKQFKSFILGKCRCGCNNDIPIRSWGYLRKFIRNHKSKGDKHHNWKGGRKLDSYNYIEIYKPDYFSSNKQRYVKEHIYIFQEYHKCCMLSWGRVHHIIPVNKGGTNDIGNLQGITHVKHMILHNTKDMTTRKCSNLKCKTPYITLIDNGRPHWYGNEIDGWLCNKCYHKQKRRTKK